MFYWIKENIATIIIGTITAIAFILAVIKIVHDARQGGCGCGCKNCSASSSCRKKKE